MHESEFQAFLTMMTTSLEVFESLKDARFYMDHIISGKSGYEGDYSYHGIENLPTIGSSVSGFYDAGDGSKPYLFRVVGLTFYEAEVSELRESKAIGAILIDPVMESPVKGTAAIAA